MAEFDAKRMSMLAKLHSACGAMGVRATRETLEEALSEWTLEYTVRSGGAHWRFTRGETVLTTQKAVCETIVRGLADDAKADRAAKRRRLEEAAEALVMMSRVEEPAAAAVQPDEDALCVILMYVVHWYTQKRIGEAEVTKFWARVRDMTPGQQTGLARWMLTNPRLPTPPHFVPFCKTHM